MLNNNQAYKTNQFMITWPSKLEHFIDGWINDSLCIARITDNIPLYKSLIKKKKVITFDVKHHYILFKWSHMSSRVI